MGSHKNDISYVGTGSGIKSDPITPGVWWEGGHETSPKQVVIVSNGCGRSAARAEETSDPPERREAREGFFGAF